MEGGGLQSFTIWKCRLTIHFLDLLCVLAGRFDITHLGDFSATPQLLRFDLVGLVSFYFSISISLIS